MKRELSLGYRVLGLAGLGRGLLAHLTLRMPQGDTFLTYQLGQSVEEVRIADLCESDFEANSLDSRHRVNPTPKLHGVVYRARPDVHCHHHGDNSVAMGAVQAVPKPFDRSAARWYRNIDLIADQGRAIVKRLANKKAMILKFHRHRYYRRLGARHGDLHDRPRTRRWQSAARGHSAGREWR